MGFVKMPNLVLIPLGTGFGTKPTAFDVVGNLNWTQ
jgi:hypothetical protein